MKANGLLSAISALERALCALGFLVMTVALGADVGARLWSRLIAQGENAGWLDAALADRLSAGGGVLGASQVAVIGMIMTALFGLGIAAGQGAELRARLFDRIWPARWSGIIDRLANAATAAVLCILAWLCAAMAAESFGLKDVSSVLRLPTWPLQAMVAFAFGLAALRYLLYSAHPALRPSIDAVPETAQREGGLR